MSASSWRPLSDSYPRLIRRLWWFVALVWRETGADYRLSPAQAWSIACNFEE